MTLSFLKAPGKALSQFEKSFSKIVPYVWGILSVCMFTTGTFFVKKLSNNLTVTEILFVRSLIQAISSYITITMEGSPFHYKIPRLNKLLILRGVSGTLVLLFQYYGIKLLTFSDAIVLSQVYPPATGILATLWLGDKYEWSQLIAALICMTGVIFIAQPTSIFGENSTSSTTDSSFRMIGITSALLSAFCMGFSDVLIKKMGGKTSAAITTLYFGLVTSLVAAVTSLFEGFNPFNLFEAGLLILIGLLSFLGQMLRNRAITLGAAGRVSNTSYFGIVFSYILDIFVLGTDINNYSLLGALCISSVMFIYIYRIYKQEQKA